MQANNKPTFRQLVKRALRQERMGLRLAGAGIEVDHCEHEVVVGNAYPIRQVLKAAGFKLDAGSKTWRFTTKTYKNFKFNQGRLQDAQIVRRAEPEWMPAACRALAE